MRDALPIKHAVECGNLTWYETSAHNQKAVGCENLIKIKTFQARIDSSQNSTQSFMEIYTEQMSFQLELEYVYRRCLSNFFLEFIPHMSCGKRESPVTVVHGTCARNLQTTLWRRSQGPRWNVHLKRNFIRPFGLLCLLHINTRLYHVSNNRHFWSTERCKSLINILHRTIVVATETSSKMASMLCRN